MLTKYAFTFLALFCFSLIVSSSAFAADATHNSRNAVDWAGVYRGMIPCADCEGIEQEITLSPDGQYSLRPRYKNKSQKVFHEEGEFQWSNDNSIITLSPEKNGQRYYVGEGQLLMLDQAGQKIEGDLAPLYKLSKQDEPALTETYWKLVELMGKPVGALSRDAYIILKAEDGKVTGSGGCNRIAGGYEVVPEKNRIRFSKMISTMMACVKGMDTEHAFTEMLGRADSYTISGGKLQLLRARMAPLAVFEPVYLY